MNKVGKKVIFDNINKEIDFTLDDMLDHFNISSFTFQNGQFLNSDKSLNLEQVEKLVKPYIDAKVKEKFGEDYEVFKYYDTLNLSWNVEIEGISKITDYRKKTEKKLKLPKLKKV
tara:strand:+ start:273 stop:617 length:345 start_codon:yes stop_codon:yes gene_type:complete